MAWFFLRVQPVNFGMLWLVADALSLLELLFLDDLTPFSDKMLRCVADMMWTTMLIFAGLQVRASAGVAAEGQNDAVDLNMMCLQMGLIFLLLFVSQWFKYYSLNLAGQRKGQIGTSLENALVEVSNNALIDRILHFCSNVWLLSMYMDAFPAKTGFPAGIGNLVMPIAALRGVIMLIELRLACLRIIDLDVQDRKKLVAEEKAEAGKAK